MTKTDPSASNFWAWVKLVLTLIVFTIIIIGIKFAVTAFNAAVDSTKQNLQARGVNVSADGCGPTLSLQTYNGPMN